MHKFFSLESKFMNLLSRLADLVILNFLYLLTCLPLITIGAATTAMYTTCFRFSTDREEGTLKTYFRAFGSNFKQATELWLIILLGCIIIAVDAYFFYSRSGVFHYVYFLFAAAAVLILLTCTFTFPLLSQFYNPNKVVLKNSLILSVAHFPVALVMTILNVLPLVLLILALGLYLQVGFLWIFVYHSAVAYINVHFLHRVFAPYIPEQDS